jgi:hypothetical protein
LLAANESTLPTPHPKLRIAKARPEDGGWLKQLIQWLARTDMPDEATARVELAQWVPEYKNTKGAP